MRVRSALSNGPVAYENGWAWQQVLLGRRLECIRRRTQRRRRDVDVDVDNDVIDDPDDDLDDDDRDWLLLFEHEPTYTLGRGASVDHLTFLDDGTSRDDDRRRLRRDYRGIDASRLQVDRRSDDDSPPPPLDRRIGVEDEVDIVLTDRRRRAAVIPPVIAPNGAPVHRVERGGEVTFHGPGQLVLYPLLSLDGDVRRRDLHGYLRLMEEVAIRALSRYGVHSYRDPDRTGVWVDGSKIAAVGVSCSRWITAHGLALNVDVDLRYFDADVVRPCGIGDRGVTSLARAMGGNDDDSVKRPTVEEVGRVALECFGEVFGVDLVQEEGIR